MWEQVPQRQREAVLNRAGGAVLNRQPAEVLYGQWREVLHGAGKTKSLDSPVGVRLRNPFNGFNDREKEVELNAKHRNKQPISKLAIQYLLSQWIYL